MTAAPGIPVLIRFPAGLTPAQADRLRSIARPMFGDAWLIVSPERLYGLAEWHGDSTHRFEVVEQ